MVKDTPEVDESGGERPARRQLLEELFYDFDHSRSQIYWTNFVRGIFFGLGSVLGGTVIVALIVWLLGQLVGFPVVGEYIRHTVTVIQHYK